MNAHTHTLAGVNRPASLVELPPAFGSGGFSRRGGCKPVTYEGVTYPSETALARALGMCVKTVSGAIGRGSLHTLGVGRLTGQYYATEARRQPVEAHGWYWRSQTEAARALGVVESTVSQALGRGTFGDLVLRRLGVKQ